MKVCNKCKVSKADSEFYQDTTLKGGLMNSCKDCKNKVTAEKALKNRGHNQVAATKVHASDVPEIVKLLAEGKSLTAIGDHFGASRSTISKRMKAAGVSRDKSIRMQAKKPDDGDTGQDRDFRRQLNPTMDKYRMLRLV